MSNKARSFVAHFGTDLEYEKAANLALEAAINFMNFTGTAPTDLKYQSIETNRWQESDEVIGVIVVLSNDETQFQELLAQAISLKEEYSVDEHSDHELASDEPIILWSPFCDALEELNKKYYGVTK